VGARTLALLRHAWTSGRFLPPACILAARACVQARARDHHSVLTSQLSLQHSYTSCDTSGRAEEGGRGQGRALFRHHSVPCELPHYNATLYSSLMGARLDRSPRHGAWRARCRQPAAHLLPPRGWRRPGAGLGDACRHLRHAACLASCHLMGLPCTHTSGRRMVWKEDEGVTDHVVCLCQVS